MTKMRALIIAVFGITILAVGVTGKQPPRHAPENEHVQQLIRAIQAGDRAAVEEAGKSGNRLFVPYLKQKLKNRKRKGEGFKRYWPAELALARLGEQQQLEEFWCSAVSEDPQVASDPPVSELGLIGGWFAIQALQNFLTSEAQTRWYEALKKNPAPHARDVMISETPATQALQVLPHVVDSPPIQYSRESSPDSWDRQIKVWQDWIAAHKDELSKLEPTGEGVDFSDKACKNGKPRKKH